MRHDDAFHFVGINIEAGHEDHVLLAVLDEHQAAIIDPANIPGAQPIAADHHLRGFIRAVPVTRHHLRTAHADLAHLVDAEFPAFVVTNADVGGRYRQADGAVEVFAGQVDARGRRSLGEAPGLREDLAGYFLPSLGHGFLHGHAAA